MSKPKTARSVSTNVGIRLKFQKKLIKFQSEFLQGVFVDIVKYISDAGQLAEDASYFDKNSPRVKRLIKELGPKVLTAWRRDPVRFRQDIEAYIDQHLAEWTVNATSEAKAIAIWMALAIAADVTASQRKAYIAAGLSPDYFRGRWTSPITATTKPIKTRRMMSKEASELLPQLVEWSTGLITKMAVKDVHKLQELMIRGFTEGNTVSAIEKMLRATDGFNADRAHNVAIDQTNKVTQGIKRANDHALGITQGIWVHVPGQYSSRETHKVMNGKIFDLDVGLYDSAAKRFTLPSIEPYCRCTYRAVIPKETI